MFNRYNLSLNNFLKSLRAEGGLVDFVGSARPLPDDLGTLYLQPLPEPWGVDDEALVLAALTADVDAVAFAQLPHRRQRQVSPVQLKSIT